MQALFVSDTRPVESYPSLRVRVKNKPVAKLAKKPRVKYPKIIMPEQPVGYIKPKRHECW